MEKKEKIRLNQIYKSKKSDFQVIIIGKKGGKWKANVLTDRTGVYAGRHTFAEMTLRKSFIKIG